MKRWLQKFMQAQSPEVARQAIGVEPPSASTGTGVTDHASLTGLSADDHTQYALADGSRGTFEASGAVAAHAAAADPHTGYQKESEKDAANGYAGLSASSKLAFSQIPVGATSTTVCVGDDARLSNARNAEGIIETSGPTVMPIGAIADGQYLRRSGSNIIGDTPSGGSGASGLTEVDFGAFPGSSDCSVNVTGQTSILSGSVVQAWLQAKDTTDHTADEHRIETISVSAGNIVAGTGFTIYAQNTSQLNEPLDKVENAGFATAKVAATAFGNGIGSRGGIGTRIYGVWTVAWRWS